MNLNKVILIGRMTADVEVKSTATNQSVANFSIATNRNWTDKSGARQEDTEFHNVVVWGRQAELAAQFLSKGSLVMIEGRLQTRSWKDKDDQTRKTTEVVCERIQFGPRSAGGSSDTSSRAQDSSSDNFDDSLEDNVPEVSVDDEIKPEDLPF